VKTIGRSLPHRVATTIARRRGITKFLSRSDGDDETPRVLLTGGLLVRVQPEEPLFRNKITHFGPSPCSSLPIC